MRLPEVPNEFWTHPDYNHTVVAWDEANQKVHVCQPGLPWEDEHGPSICGMGDDAPELIGAEHDQDDICPMCVSVIEGVVNG